MKNFVVIGNGKMAMNCISHMIQFKETNIGLVLFDEKLDDPKYSIKLFLEKKDIRFQAMTKLNTPENVLMIKETMPDYILNINSFKIFKSRILNIPKHGIVNFHNGPLPKYGGVNIPSWAIINGEKSHGVTWHFVNEGIDTGDILWQSNFLIDNITTSGMLMVKCILEGINIFKQNYYQLLEDSFLRIPQVGDRSYFGKKTLPDNHGYIRLSWDFSKISNLIKGLNYFPFPNNFCYAKLKNSNGELIINKVSSVMENTDISRVGKIAKANTESIQLICKDTTFEIIDAMDQNFRKKNNNEIIKTFGLTEDNYFDNHINNKIN